MFLCSLDRRHIFHITTTALFKTSIFCKDTSTLHLFKRTTFRGIYISNVHWCQMLMHICIHNGYLCTTWDCPKICTKSTFPVVVILEDVISVQRRWILEGENGIVQEGFGGNWLQRQSHNPITFCNNSFAITVVPPLSPLHFYGQTIPNPYFKRANPFSEFPNVVEL